MSRTAGRAVRLGLAARLFATDALVIVAGAGTLLAVALLAAPALFHSHLQQAHLPQVDAAVRSHVDAAFDRALSVALVLGITAATAVAAAVSWLAARRLAAPIEAVATAARRLADGHYDTHVPDPRLGPEFASLAASMDQLARRLAVTEADRRRLTADLAHQLRTPIASVRATVEAIVDGVLEPDAGTLTVLSDQTDRLTRLVGDLEKVSRAEERQIVLSAGAQGLAAVAERCVDAELERYRAKGVSLSLQVDPAAPAVRIDGARIAEAVTNLLDNALRHTTSGGHVSVAVAAVPGEPPSCRLVVADDGSGFAPADAALLFRRFHRGPDAGTGTGSGLGLTIARALVEAHGGVLSAASGGRGRGAVFTLTLPAAQP